MRGGGEGGIDERASTSWPAGRVSQLGPQQTQAVVPLGNQITRNDTKHTPCRDRGLGPASRGPGMVGWDRRAWMFLGFRHAGEAIR